MMESFICALRVCTCDSSVSPFSLMGYASCMLESAWPSRLSVKGCLRLPLVSFLGHLPCVSLADHSPLQEDARLLESRVLSVVCALPLPLRGVASAV